MEISDSLYGLYLILTDPIVGYEECAKAAVAENVRFLQLRMKNASDAEIIETGKKIREITKGSSTIFIMNDRVDLAKIIDADGAHLGQDDGSISEARKTWNSDGKYIGLSTHSFEQMKLAQNEEIDYIGIGPVFQTSTKPDASAPLGISETGKIAQASAKPHVAIGGINADNLSDVLEAGVKNFCVVSAVNQSEKPAEAIRELMNIWRTKYDR